MSFLEEYRNIPGLKESPRNLRPGVSIPQWKWRQLQAGMRFDNCHTGPERSEWLNRWMQTDDAKQYLLQDARWLKTG